jgi:hypothetical protein
MPRSQHRRSCRSRRAPSSTDVEIVGRWRRRANVWRKVTSPPKGEPRLRSGTSNVPSQTVAGLIMSESIDRLRSHFGLTLAEARLALQLVGGETLRSAAVKLNITYETARTSLKKRERCLCLYLFESFGIFLSGSGAYPRGPPVKGRSVESLPSRHRCCRNVSVSK